MDSTLRRLVLDDYLTAQRNVQRVLDNPSSNRVVIDPDYLHPSVLAESCAQLSDQNGELMYYRRIRTGLEVALTTDTIPRELRPPRAPPRIQELYC
ncbi:TPA: hypothetical protein HA241_00750 [Candidatus Woesearchaeota archaeon]|nr:hypothetical protein [Candidatus Woesearchaeota archaeon]